jgi:hypothetical protein
MTFVEERVQPGAAKTVEEIIRVAAIAIQFLTTSSLFLPGGV